MEDEVKKIDMNEIRRLQKAARDGNKQHLADWFLQFDEQVRNEHKKYAEDVIMKANREMRAEYEKAFKEELAEAIDNYIIAIAYTLKFSELTKFGPKRTKSRHSSRIPKAKQDRPVPVQGGRHLVRPALRYRAFPVP